MNRWHKQVAIFPVRKKIKFKGALGVRRMLTSKSS